MRRAPRDDPCDEARSFSGLPRDPPFLHNGTLTLRELCLTETRFTLAVESTTDSASAFASFAQSRIATAARPDISRNSNPHRNLSWYFTVALARNGSACRRQHAARLPRSHPAPVLRQASRRCRARRHLPNVRGLCRELPIARPSRQRARPRESAARAAVKVPSIPELVLPMPSDL